MGGVVDIANSPKISTAIGLLLYGLEKSTTEEKDENLSGTNIFDKLLGLMRQW